MHLSSMAQCRGRGGLATAECSVHPPVKRSKNNHLCTTFNVTRPKSYLDFSESFESSLAQVLQLLLQPSCCRHGDEDELMLN